MGVGDGPGPMGPAGQGRRRAGPRTLLVEDEPDVRLVLALMLADELGPEGSLDVAGDGHRAVELIETGSLPDLLLTGLDLPGCSGVEVVRRFRERGGLGLVVVFSAVALVDAEKVQSAIDAGADVVVPKPDVARLRDVLRQAPSFTGRRLQ